MKIIFVFIWFLVLFFFIITNVSSQKFLLLDKTGSLKNIKYFSGDLINLSAYDNSLKLEGKISGFTDSTVFINGESEIPIKNISCIQRERFMIRKITKTLYVFGAAYFVLTGFNRLINKDYPVYDKQSIMISGGIVIAGYLMHLLIFKKYKINGKWKLTILDLST